MRKTLLIGLLFLPFILVTGSQLSAEETIQWIPYQEKINMGFTLAFMHPKIISVNRIENGMCLSNQQEESEMMHTGWCIWMGDARSFDLATEMSTYKSRLGTGAKQLRQSVQINGVSAIRIILTDKKGAYFDLVYFQRFGTSFSVVNAHKSDPAYQKFFQSIKVYKEK